MLVSRNTTAFNSALRIAPVYTLYSNSYFEDLAHFSLKKYSNKLNPLAGNINFNTILTIA